MGQSVQEGWETLLGNCPEPGHKPSEGVTPGFVNREAVEAGFCLGTG